MTELADSIFWIDLETTGLNAFKEQVPMGAPDQILEIATVMTDGNLRFQEIGPSFVIRTPEKILQRMPPTVQEMHSRSGLWGECRDTGTTIEEAEAATLAWVSDRVGPGLAPLGGSTIGFDRRFLMRYMPELEAHFHYRSIDVSSVKECWRRWLPQVYARIPDDKKAHRAMDDIQESINLLRFFREDAVGHRELRAVIRQPF